MPLPNIVYILSDDWGYGDVSCLNPESKIPTPYTDALARQGMTFTDAHSNSAVCTPTRYGVLTGRYCWRGHLQDGVLGGYDDLLIEPGRPTVASLLRDAGYRTACIGKWHLGLNFARDGVGADAPFTMRSWEDDPSVHFDRPLHRGPHTVGFDYSFIIPSSLDIPPYVYIENGNIIAQRRHTCAPSPRPAYWRGGVCAEGLQHETCLLEFTMRAEQFIADQAREAPGKPFFLYFPTPSPHTPHVPRPPFQGKSRCGEYGDYVVEHDWSIGRIVSTLDRLGLADNTLIIVTSDNGPHKRFQMDDGEIFDFGEKYHHRSTWIYRGQKSDNWDGGHRIPFIARWPKMIAPGSTCGQQICLTDLYATCKSIVADQSGPKAFDVAQAGRHGVVSVGGEDSVSMLPLMAGKNEPVRDYVVHHSLTGKFAIRRGKWKLLVHPGSGGWTAPDAPSTGRPEDTGGGKTRLHETLPPDAPPCQLYDMEADPSETRNVYLENPQVAAELMALLEQCRRADRSASYPGMPRDDS